MADFSFSSPRPFRVWSYSVGHKTLLLRSVRDESNPTRIDVVIVGVAAMKLPTGFDGLTIHEATPEDRESYLSEAGLGSPRTTDDALRVYRIGEAPEVAYVIGLGAGVHEDDGAYFNPSYFDLPHQPVDEEVARLLVVLGEMSTLLAHHSSQGWADWIARDAGLIRSGDGYGLVHLLSAFGGMGSLNDVVFHPMNGNASTPEECNEATTLLQTLASEAWSLAHALQRDAGLE